MEITVKQIADYLIEEYRDSMNGIIIYGDKNWELYDQDNNTIKGGNYKDLKELIKPEKESVISEDLKLANDIAVKNKKLNAKIKELEEENESLKVEIEANAENTAKRYAKIHRVTDIFEQQNRELIEEKRKLQDHIEALEEQNVNLMTENGKLRNDIYKMDKVLVDKPDLETALNVVADLANNESMNIHIKPLGSKKAGIETETTKFIKYYGSIPDFIKSLEKKTAEDYLREIDEALDWKDIKVTLKQAKEKGII